MTAEDRMYRALVAAIIIVALIAATAGWLLVRAFAGGA